MKLWCFRHGDNPRCNLAKTAKAAGLRLVAERPGDRDNVVIMSESDVQQDHTVIFMSGTEDQGWLTDMVRFMWR
jgi:hypothetical protein